VEVKRSRRGRLPAMQAIARGERPLKSVASKSQPLAIESDAQVGGSRGWRYRESQKGGSTHICLSWVSMGSLLRAEATCT
jgi:hypothetical protein